MAEDWTVVDFTGPKGGYMTLQFQGKRVCDFFPFARGADAAWVRAQADLICRTMNSQQPDAQ